MNSRCALRLYHEPQEGTVPLHSKRSRVTTTYRPSSEGSAESDFPHSATYITAVVGCAVLAVSQHLLLDAQEVCVLFIFLDSPLTERDVGAPIDGVEAQPAGLAYIKWTQTARMAIECARFALASTSQATVGPGAAYCRLRRTITDLHPWKIFKQRSHHYYIKRQ